MALKYASSFVRYTPVESSTVNVCARGSPRGAGGGGIGTEIKYESQTKTPFTYIDKYAFVTADLDLNSTTAGATTSYVVSVNPNVTVNSGVAVTVGTGKTMVIDVLKIGDL